MAAGLPTAILVEVEFTAGVWTDIATHVVGDSIEIRVGRESAASDIQPGTLSLTLDNADGQWTPDNPTSTRYPNWVEGKRIRVRVTKGTTSTRFVGRITSIVPDFPTEPSQSRVAVSAVDLLGDLQQVSCESIVKQGARTAALNSLRCYPLDDVSPRLASRELQARDNDLVISGKVELAGDDSFGVDGATATVFTDGGSMSAATSRDDWRYGGVGFVYGAAVYCFVKVTNGVAFDIFSLQPGSRNGEGVQVTWNGTRFDCTVTGPSGVALANMTPNRDGWHFVGVRIEDDTVDTTEFIGDSTVDTMAVFSSNPIADQALPILTLGGSGSGSIKDLWIGNSLTANAVQYDLAYEAAYGGSLPFTDALTVLNAALPMTNLAGTIAASGTSTKTVSALATAGRSALDVVVALAAVECGRVFHEYSTNATQTIRIVTMADDRPRTVALTVDAELDLDGGPTMSRSSADTVVLISAESPTQSVTVSDSAQTSSGSSETLSSFRDTLAELRAQAEDRQAAGRERRLRVSNMTVDLSTAVNDLYASLWALTPGERVRLTNLPSTYFGVTYTDGYVEGWTERPGVTGYEVTFDLSPADAPPEGLWDDATYGRWGFGDGVATNTSSATSSATSVQFEWTGGLTLSTSAGDYPLDLDWNGERVTVTSAPAGGSSPQTLTITRGVAPTVARAHNAGETVDIWNAARWAM